MKKKIIILLIIYMLGVLTPVTLKKMHKKVLEDSVIYEVRIVAEKINVRPEVSLNTEVIKQVYKDETFKVIKYYEGNSYNWYNVIYEDGKIGWIASGKTNAWVEVIDGCENNSKEEQQ